MQLEKKSPSSYRVDDRQAVVDHLSRHGYRCLPGRSPSEAARMTRQVSDGRAIAVLYWNGTVLVQGSKQGRAEVHDVLETLEEVGA